MAKPPAKSSLIIPVLLITAGIGWLLTTMNLVPGFDWTLTLGLAVAGYLTLAIIGVDKVTVVLAPLLLCASALSIIHQTTGLSFGVSIPILVILAGGLMLIARRPWIPSPKWIVGNPSDKKDGEGKQEFGD